MFSSSLFVTMTMGVAGCISFMRCLETRQARHLLVEEHQVEGLRAALVDGVGSVADGHDLVAFLFEEDDVGLQQLYLVIDP